MKDVIFVEDSRNMPIGRVIKVDGQHTVVHFPVGGEKNPAPPSAPAGKLIEFLDAQCSQGHLQERLIPFELFTSIVPMRFLWIP